MMNNTMDCYWEWGTRMTNTKRKQGIIHPIFTIFDNKNIFVAFGCDTYTSLKGFKNKE